MQKDAKPHKSKQNRTKASKTAQKHAKTTPENANWHKSGLNIPKACKTAQKQAKPDKKRAKPYLNALVLDFDNCSNI
jgi:hypothetical protein